MATKTNGTGNKEGLAAMDKSSLQQICRDKNISFTTKTKHEELVKLIEEYNQKQTKPTEGRRRGGEY